MFKLCILNAFLALNVTRTVTHYLARTEMIQHSYSSVHNAAELKARELFL